MEVEKMVTLAELLDSRERRASHQKELMLDHEGTLVSVTLNIPGPIKDSPKYRRLMERIAEEILEDFGGDGEQGLSGEVVWSGEQGRKMRAKTLTYHEVRHSKTGSESYFIISPALEPKGIKARTIALEQKKSWGRLADIDVITSQGAISRTDLGARPRRCLLCQREAKLCAREQSHPLEELLAKIDEIIETK